jgi:hypothetical protein
MHLRIRIVLRFGTVQIELRLDRGARSDGRQRGQSLPSHVFILTQPILNRPKKLGLWGAREIARLQTTAPYSPHILPRRDGSSPSQSGCPESQIKFGSCFAPYGGTSLSFCLAPHSAGRPRFPL